MFCMLARDTRVLDKVANEWEQFHTSHLQVLPVALCSPRHRPAF